MIDSLSADNVDVFSLGTTSPENALTLLQTIIDNNTPEVEARPDLTNDLGVAAFLNANNGMINLDGGLSSTSSPGNYVPLMFEDQDIDGRLFHLASGSAVQLSAQANAALSTLASDTLLTLQGAGSPSLFDVAVELTSVLDTTSESESNIILTALTDFRDFAISRHGELLDETGRIKESQRAFDSARRLTLSSQINAKFVSSIVNSALNDPLGLLSDELKPFANKLKTLQAAAIAASDPAVISSNDYSFNYAAPSQAFIHPADSDAAIEMQIAKIGYMIQKTEFFLDDTTGKLRPATVSTLTGLPYTETIFVGPNTTHYKDSKIKYGNYYQYSLRSLALVFLPAFASNEAGEAVQSQMIGTIISSKPITQSQIAAEDNLEPPSPQSFYVDWDYSNDMLRLTWDSPINTKNNVVKYQVFRRKSILDPFTLIKEYNWDPRPGMFFPINQGRINAAYGETPLQSVVENPAYGKNIYHDPEFTKSSSYIYAVCAVNSAYRSSRLSPQYSVAFDRNVGKISRKLISHSGANKSLPNGMMHSQVFVESMKTSGFSNIKIFFDPEYLVVKDAENNALNIISHAPNGIDVISTEQLYNRYRMNFLNVDLQKSREIDIVVEDHLSTTDDVGMQEGLIGMDFLRSNGS